MASNRTQHLLYIRICALVITDLFNLSMDHEQRLLFCWHECGEQSQRTILTSIILFYSIHPSPFSPAQVKTDSLSRIYALFISEY